MIWVLCTLLIGLAAAFAAAPFLGRTRATASENPRAALYRRQVAEINAAAAGGTIDASEAAALRVEAQRRLLAAADAANREVEIMQAPRAFAAVTIAGIVVAAGAGLYALRGSPMTPSARPAATADPAARGTPDAPGDVDGLIEGLKAKLAGDPENADGWRMLGWSYFSLGRYEEAADAYARAAALAPGAADYQSAYGETLVMIADEIVTPAASKAFDAALRTDPEEPRARYFKGLALDQAGDPAGAISAWIEIANSAPPGAEWASELEMRIRERAREADIDIADQLKASISAPPSPTADQIRDAMELGDGDRQAMIEGMVASLAARLQENPQDLEGWLRLIRSRMVLGRPVEARGDLGRALAAFPGDAAARARIVAEAEALGVVK